ncbi:hypothetical protein FRC91_19635 [Bradymonadales bacterium TMQ1]|uniref:Septum formation-related domain-containing protein n=1 Tax=Lujinxingia sediminis TaxID=2480984 RepID=A0ABY0CN12_9DELT|nr:hypothetical protein [Lujinxingia sediminis]RVU41056.1 hypothetical protein EA187_19335 [Lujinxingia sediminis]TXC67893.1 hypothetical protein FRC91_19635 [Bradymonadales bacterium TMQ1]
MMTYDGRSKRWSRACATLSLLGLAVVGGACGQAESEFVDYGEASASLESSAIGAGPQTSRGEEFAGIGEPISEYYDANDNYFLECHTGADLAPLHVTFDADVMGWVHQCMGGLSEGSDGEAEPVAASAAQLRECVNGALSKSVLSGTDKPGQGGGTPKTRPPITNFRYDGATWAACNTGADLDAFRLPGGEGEYATWRETCLGISDGGTGGTVGVGVGHDFMHELAGGSASGNPVCGELLSGHSPRRREGAVLTCSTRPQVISMGRGAEEQRAFAAACQAADSGLMSKLEFMPGTDMHREAVYSCTGNATTLAHSRGYEAFVGFESRCLREGGEVVVRMQKSARVSVPEADSRMQYICSSTGATLGHDASIYAYEAFSFGCHRSFGRVLSTFTSAELVEPAAMTVGRGGRVDSAEGHEEMAHVVGGKDMNGKTIYICMPKGDHIGPGATYQEFSLFESECKQRGGIVKAFFVRVEAAAVEARF